MSKLIILDGPSCSGKTSIAKELQEFLLPELWFNISIDTITYALPKSVLDKCNKHNDWGAVNNDILFSSTFSLVRSMLENGANVIFDVVISTPERAKDLQNAVTGFDKKFIGITCELNELEKRAKNRGDRTYEEVLHGYNTSPKQFEYDMQVDTTIINISETAKKVVSCLI